MKHDVTPEEKTGAVENGPPAKHSLPLPLLAFKQITRL
ncbi:MAG: hypothetical protein H6Q47_100 [Deltaproteobacteria bacterium]|nr:hypothetical protein [Deltaproteobacteria bacterium]